MVGPLLNGEADIVIGSRYVESGGTEDWAIQRKISSKVATLAVRGLTRVNDPMSGFFFLRKKVIENVRLNPTGFKIALEILVRGKYDKVVEVPIIFKDRIYGETKLSGGVILEYLLQVATLYAFKIFKY
jgi:dolichol-phosphate mannosyltransferase